MMENQTNLQDWQNFFDERVRGRRDLVSGYIKYIAKLEKARLPPIFELRHLSGLIGVDEAVIVRIAQTPETFYRNFEIPKRLGGTRTISVPSPTALTIQRWVLTEILSKLDIHSRSFGFVPKRSVVDNAREHLGQKVHLKLDLKDFFPSIKFNRVMKVFLSAGYPVSIAYFLARICCVNKSLPQGAATSPTLSNLVAKRLDIGLAAYSSERDLTYTRYADDLTFSGDKISSTEISQISYIINQQGFYLNEKKTLLLGEKSKKIVTGVSITSGKLALPRRTVREIKLETYHLIKNGYFVHSKAKGKFDPLLMERLRGRIGFWLQIDPENVTAKRLQAQLAQYVAEFDASL